MTETVIRKLDGQKMKQAFYDLSIYAFSVTPPMPEIEKWFADIHEQPGARCWAALEDDHAAAVMGYTSMIQNVRGKLVPMGGVWGVASAPETRRKGYVRQIMAAAYADMRAEGMAVSGLYPFRESFYERLGYLSFPSSYSVKIPLASLTPLLKQTLGGSVQRMLAADGIPAYRAFLEEMRTRVHGMAFIDEELDEKIKKNNFWMLVVKENGKDTGFMLYRIEEEERWQKSIYAEYFYYSTPLARMKMLEWLARHTDQIEHANIQLPPWEHPDLWLPDLKSKMKLFLSHAPMGRVIDVAMLNGIPCGPGCFSAAIKDPFCPWNEGAWRFKCVDGVLQVEGIPFAESTLSIQGLAAWLYGSIDPGDFSLRGLGEIQPGTAASMRIMLPLAPAYMHETY